MCRHTFPRGIPSTLVAGWLGWLSLLGLFALLTGCASHRPPLERHEFSSIQMAIPFRIVLYTPDAATATNAAAAVWQRISQLNDSLSDYDAESELSRFSAGSPHTEWIPLSEDLGRVLSAGQQVAAASDGAFDMTVGPLTLLWRKARRTRELPSPDRLITARAAVGWQALELRSRDGRTEGRLLRPGMRLDLGGIAKGYALDAATQVLKQHGVTQSLVAGAGDIVVTDPPPGLNGWKIEIAPLDVSNAPPARHVWLRRASLCTSGDLIQHVEIDGVRYSHIVDPRTGVGLTDHSLVTVIGREGMWTDACSKAVSVTGLKRGWQQVRQFGVEARVIRQRGAHLEEWESPGFARYGRDGGR